jgi:hypothetical protein
MRSFSIGKGRLAAGCAIARAVEASQVSTAVNPAFGNSDSHIFIGLSVQEKGFAPSNSAAPGTSSQTSIMAAPAAAAR